MNGTKQTEMGGRMCAPIGRVGEAESRQQMENRDGRYGESRTAVRYGTKLWHGDSGGAVSRATMRESSPGYNG